MYAQANRHVHVRDYTVEIWTEVQTRNSFFLAAGTNKNLEESFVMLAGSASSMRHAPSHATTNGKPLQPLDIKFAQMARVFEIASEATKASSQAI